MAWIVKDSANTKIVRRDEPYLSDAIRAHFEKEILPRYATKQAALLPLMHEIQHAHEWIPHQAMEEAAEFLGLSVAEVIDTVTFYEEFRLRPVGQYLIQICRSISCELCGYQDLSARVQKNWASFRAKPPTTAGSPWSNWNASAPAAARRRR